MSEDKDEELRSRLKQIIDHFDMEDRSVRDRQIRLWRRMKLYWGGFHKVWYSEVNHDWQIHDDVQSDGQAHTDYYDKPVNVYRAYLESIIAALSVLVPPVKCSPDDADNPLDMSTAKAGNRIAELVYKHNDVILLWVHALFVFVTEGLVACRNYTKESKEFGTYEVEERKDFDVTGRFCPECDSRADSAFPLVTEPQEQEVLCPECGAALDPFQAIEARTESRIVGITDHPKSRQILEVHGGLYVKIPNYAKTQAECPYLTYSHEIHYAEAIEEYEELRSLQNDWQSKVGYDSGGVYDPYERWGRLNPQYQGEYPTHTVTIRECWLRPCSYNVLDEEEAKIIRKKFPDGVKLVLANDEVAEDPIAEQLDDHWTLTKNPLSDHLHHDPLGLLLTSIQDITDELVSLVLQTIEHGIPQTFADPGVINFDEYRQTEVLPGAIYPGRPRAGKGMGDAFYEIKTATLSAEVLPFAQKIQELGQLVSGALPSLFGGTTSAGSQTAAEYSMSRAQALQRQQNVWKMLTIWWKTIFGKVIPAYIANVKEDEQFVTKDQNGKFINTFIRKSEIQGKIGDIELEADEQMPITLTQMRDVVMRLFETQIPAVLEALTSPENLHMISKAIGLDQFKIPGEADRQKQYEEIDLLLQSTPIPREMPDPATGLPVEQEGPSVPVDQLVDNHTVEAEICRGWAISEAGQEAKKDNLPGYTNVILHMKDHIDFAQMIQMQQMAPPPEEPGNKEQANARGN